MGVGFAKGRKSSFSTHLDRIYMWIWLALTMTMALMIFFLNGKWDIISPMVLIMAGFATFLSGKLIKFKPMVYGGISFWLWSLIAYFVGPYYGLLITSAGIFSCYVIPGMMLQHSNNDI
jgi:Fe2+ transport system protein B